MQSAAAEKRMESPDKQCPIHKKPYPLKKCRSFRAKPIDGHHISAVLQPFVLRTGTLMKIKTPWDLQCLT